MLLSSQDKVFFPPISKGDEEQSMKLTDKIAATFGVFAAAGALVAYRYSYTSIPIQITIGWKLIKITPFDIVGWGMCVFIFALFGASLTLIFGVAEEEVGRG
jgi:hypothetical protein